MNFPGSQKSLRLGSYPQIWGAYEIQEFIFTLQRPKLWVASPQTRRKLWSIKEWPGKRKWCSFELVPNVPCTDLTSSSGLRNSSVSVFPGKGVGPAGTGPREQGGSGLGSVWLFLPFTAPLSLIAQLWAATPPTCFSFCLLVLCTLFQFPLLRYGEVNLPGQQFWTQMQTEDWALASLDQCSL